MKRLENFQWSPISCNHISQTKINTVSSMGRPYGVTQAAANFLVNASVWSQSNHVIWPWVEPIRTSRKIRDGDQKKARRGSAHKGAQTEKNGGDFMCKNRNLLSTFMPTVPRVARSKIRKYIFWHVCAGRRVSLRSGVWFLCMFIGGKRKRQITGRWRWPLPPPCLCPAARLARIQDVRKSQGDREAQRLQLGHYKTRPRQSWHRVCALAALARG